MDNKRWLSGVPLFATAVIALSGCINPPAPPPPPGPAVGAPPAAGRSNLPDLPPDPRAAKQPGSTGTAPAAGSVDTASVGTTALPAKAVAGSALNKFFPAGDGDTKRVFTQEKDGFALAELTKNGRKIAQISINDCAARPETRDKFKTANRAVSGFPAMTEGMNSGLAVLVGDRYQVKVRTSSPEFHEADMEEWLAKFDLAGLAKLK